MGVQIYQHTDASAPQLSGENGKLIALLDACLVNGYGAKPSLGWSKAFSGTNKAAYRNAAGMNQAYMQVIDDGSTPTRGARAAMVRGYESMTDVDNGSGPFPTVAQLTSGTIWQKSVTTDAAAVPWILIGDEGIFYLFAQWQHNHPTYSIHAGSFCFGDIESFKPSDGYKTLIVGDNSTGAPSFPGHYSTFPALSSGPSATQTGKYMARSFTQIGGSIVVGFAGDNAGGTTTMGAGSLTFPSPVDNGFYISTLLVNHDSVYRGVLPGLYQPLHSKPLAHGDTVDNIVGLSGRTLLIVGVATSSVDYRCAVDITGPWR